MVYDYLKTHGTFAKLKAKDKNVKNPTIHHLPLLSGVIKNLRRLEGVDPSATGKLATQKGIRERMGMGSHRNYLWYQNIFRRQE